MGFLDDVKAKAGEVTKAAQDGLADQQAKKKADALFLELGKWTYAKHKGSFDGADENITRVLGELSAHEAEHGEFGAKKEEAPPPRLRPPPAPPAACGPSAATLRPLRSRRLRRRPRPHPPRRHRRPPATRSRRPRPQLSRAMTRVGVFGAAGRMGSTVCEAVETTPTSSWSRRSTRSTRASTSGVADVDSQLQVAKAIQAARRRRRRGRRRLHRRRRRSREPRFARQHGLHAVVGTTGFTDADLDKIRATFTKSSCLIAANFAIGAVLMMRFAELAAPWFETAEIIELHHDGKIDARRARRCAPPTHGRGVGANGRDDPTDQSTSSTAPVAAGPRGSRSTRCASRPRGPPRGAARHRRPDPHDPPRHLSTGRASCPACCWR